MFTKPLEPGTLETRLAQTATETSDTRHDIAPNVDVSRIQKMINVVDVSRIEETKMGVRRSTTSHDVPCARCTPWINGGDACPDGEIPRGQSVDHPENYEVSLDQEFRGRSLELQEDSKENDMDSKRRAELKSDKEEDAADRGQKKSQARTSKEKNVNIWVGYVSPNYWDKKETLAGAARIIGGPQVQDVRDYVLRQLE